VLTQTKPFPPPAVATAFPTGFAGFAEPAAIPDAGVPPVAVVLEALERFSPIQPMFDGRESARGQTELGLRLPRVPPSCDCASAKAPARVPAPRWTRDLPKRSPRSLMHRLLSELFYVCAFSLAQATPPEPGWAQQSELLGAASRRGRLGSRAGG
jgi:hypothetical protein